jgi:hypothetical protein
MKVVDNCLESVLNSDQDVEDFCLLPLPLIIDGCAV